MGDHAKSTQVNNEAKTSEEEGRSSLRDIRVLDLTQFLAGPYCTMLLADLGAEVIKIERPDRGDMAREMGPFSPMDKDRKVGGYFLSINRNKKSVKLNLRNPAGRGVFEELVRVSDVVVENFTPATMDRLGLGYGRLREINPRVVYASLSGFGHTDIYKSPYWDRPSFDLIGQAMGGIMSVTGPKGGPPLKVGPGIGDIFPAALCAFGIMAALHARQKTGQGQHVDVAIYDSMVSLCERAVFIYSLTGEVSAPIGNRHPLFAPYSAFRAKDGYVVIAAPNQEIWERLCRAMGKEEWLSIPELSSPQKRADNFDSMLARLIEEWTIGRTRDEVTRTLLDNGVPASPINTVKDIFECPHIAARDMLPEVEDKTIGKTRIAGNPVKMSETPVGVRFSAPLLGEHNEEVLRSLLGYSDEKLEELKRTGAI